MRAEELGLLGLRVYVPELLAFREKDSTACRKLLEDLAILDADERRILSFRGRRFEKALPDAFWGATDRRTLVPERGGCFLLFPKICRDEPLMLALYFRHSAKEISSALRLLDRTDFSGLCGKESVGQELFDLVAEVLFYLDGLLASTHYLPLRTLILRAANFAGCRLKKADLATGDFQLDPDESALFLAFLTCFFLSVRACGGIAIAEDTPDLSIRVLALPEEHGLPFPKDAPFFSCKSFRRFRLVEKESTRAVVLPLRKPSPNLSSGGRSVYLSLLLTCDGD